MTTRLYHTDGYLRQFESRLRAAREHEGGWYVQLEATAFYATGGGQPHDTGTLDGAAVLDVHEDESGDIVHVLDRRPAEGVVQGIIRWDRRFDHMQQHTGQHLLSAVFVEIFRFPTVSFHMGEDLSTIDLAANAVSEAQIVEAERRANHLISENRPVKIFFRESQQLGDLELRKEVKREGLVRLVEIEGVDTCACGGTHLSGTAQIGAILLRRTEKAKQGVRVEFVCGGRAVHWARRDYQALTQAAAHFTAGPHQVPELVAKKVEEGRVADKERRRLLEKLASYEARELVAAAVPDARGIRTVERIADEGDADYFRMLAAQVGAQPSARALFAIRRSPTLFVAQSKGLEGSPELGALVKRLGLRGGGTRDQAQAGAADVAALDAAIAEIRKAFE